MATCELEVESENSLRLKISSAAMYGMASFMITIVNKMLLTTHSFPSYQVLGLGQMATTVVLLGLSRTMGLINFPPLEDETFGKIWPLPIVYLANVVTGLGGTQQLSLPMYTALRRFSILMTMIAEMLIFGIRPSTSVQISVFALILGAVIAASDDCVFAPSGYFLVIANDVFTSMHGIILKKKLELKELGKYGLMYYNCLFMLVPASIIAWQTGDLEASYAFESWTDPTFAAKFASSCLMGFLLSYAIVQCTLFNGALTTTIIGCLKNIFVTYIGMFVGGDYVFSWTNFIGLNMSVLGSLFYTYITFIKSDKTLVKNSTKIEIA